MKKILLSWEHLSVKIYKFTNIKSNLRQFCTRCLRYSPCDNCSTCPIYIYIAATILIWGKSGANRQKNPPNKAAVWKNHGKVDQSAILTSAQTAEAVNQQKYSNYCNPCSYNHCLSLMYITAGHHVTSLYNRSIISADLIIKKLVFFFLFDIYSTKALVKECVWKYQDYTAFLQVNAYKHSFFKCLRSNQLNQRLPNITN